MNPWVHYLLGWAACIAIGVAWLVSWRRGRGRTSSAASAIEFAAQRARDLTEDYEAMRQENERLRIEHGRLQRRDDERTEALLGVQKERDDRMQLYLRMAAEHGAAQDILMRQINSLGWQHRMLCRAVQQAKTLPDAIALTKRDLRLDPIVRQVYEEFAAEHRDGVPLVQDEIKSPPTANASA